MSGYPNGIRGYLPLGVPPSPLLRGGASDRIDMLVGCSLYKNTCFLSEQGDMSPCATRTHVFLLDTKTCLLSQQEDMSSFSTRRRRHVLLSDKKSCLLVQQEDMTSYPTTTRHVFLLDEKTCLLAHLDTEWVVLKINCLGSHAGVMYLNIMRT